MAICAFWCMAFGMVIEINHITKKYGATVALKDVTFSLQNGITGLLGPNGAGKSTLMRLLTTIEKPTAGEILYNGQNIVKRANLIRPVLGYLPQDFGVYTNLNPVEFLEYMAALSRLPIKQARKRIDELLAILNLSDVKKRLLGTFSGGMKQRVGIAQALLNDPDVLIVDEPTVGLDPEERIGFRNLLASLSENRIILLSTHIVTDVESIAPQIAIIREGCLLKYDSPENLIKEVDDMVWNCIVPSSKLPELQKHLLISSSIQRSDGIHIRVVSAERPSSDAVLTPPTLEDAYLFTARTNGETAWAKCG